ncbi:FecR family protein [Spirosoma litoris]
MESEINKELIFSHFARKVSPLQRELIAQWVRDKANEEQYYEWLEEWESGHPQYLAQTEQSIEAYTAFLAANPHTQENPSSETAVTYAVSRPWNRPFWLVAASVVLIASLAGLLFRDKLIYQTYSTTFGETRSIKLVDGSQVILNANSSLRVPRWGFGHTTREVLLAGEAKFSVTHMADDQTFVVKTSKGLDVVVLGTEFTVFTRKRGARVVLNKGKVQLHYQENKIEKQVTMKPGDLVTLDPENHIALKTVKQSQFPTVSQEKRFVFEETTLEEVAYMLEENYGLRVDIKNQALAQRILMGSFQADNVDQLLLSISELLDINVVRQGNHVQIMEK